MNLNYPVKMVPQEVKTPLVPDSGMCTESSTMGFTGDKRKAGPDALSAPDAKKSATSDASNGLPREDETHLDCLSAGDALCKALDRYKFEGEPVAMGEDEDFAEELVYDTTGPGDLTALHKAVAAVHPPGGGAYTKRFEVIKRIQFLFEETAVERGQLDKNCGKMHMEALLTKEGNVGLAFYDIIN